MSVSEPPSSGSASAASPRPFFLGGLEVTESFSSCEAALQGAKTIPADEVPLQTGELRAEIDEGELRGSRKWGLRDAPEWRVYWSEDKVTAQVLIITIC